MEDKKKRKMAGKRKKEQNIFLVRFSSNFPFHLQADWPNEKILKRLLTSFCMVGCFVVRSLFADAVHHHINSLLHASVVGIVAAMDGVLRTARTPYAAA